MLWDSTTDRRAVWDEVLTLVNPDAKKALDLEEDILGIQQTLESMAGQATEKLNEWASKEANPKLSRAAKELEAMRAAAEADGRSTDAIDQVIARLRAVYARVLTEALNMPASVVQNLKI